MWLRTILVDHLGRLEGRVLVVRRPEVLAFVLVLGLEFDRMVKLGPCHSAIEASRLVEHRGCQTSFDHRSYHQGLGRCSALPCRLEFEEACHS